MIVVSVCLPFDALSQCIPSYLGFSPYSSWDSPGQNPGVGSLSLLQGIFPTQGSKPCLPHCRQILYHLCHQGNPTILEWVAYPFSSGSSGPRNWIGVSCSAGGFFTRWVIRKAQSESEVAQSCLTLCHPIDCSLPGSSLHGILQARILEWVAISFSRRSSLPRDLTRVSHIVSRHFTVWATREVYILLRLLNISWLVVKRELDFISEDTSTYSNASPPRFKN